MRSVPGAVSRAALVAGAVLAVGGSGVGCAALLDWNGFTDGGETREDASVGDDASEAGAGQDATDASDAADDVMAVRDTGSAADVVVGVDGSIPKCGLANGCEGCCNAAGECVGGRSTATCGTIGVACTDCSASGQVCNPLGMCVMASADAGPPPACVATSCPPLCIPVWQGTCCKSDNTCGCEVVIPPSGMCM